MTLFWLNTAVQMAQTCIRAAHPLRSGYTVASRQLIATCRTLSVGSLSCCRISPDFSRFGKTL